MLDDNQIAIVQTSFAHLRGEEDSFTLDFYKRLFVASPEVRPFFPEDITNQAKVLNKTLIFAVNGLKKLEDLVGPLKKLGAQHVSYGVKNEHYPIVTNTLIDTLACNLEDIWTPEHELAWRTGLGLISDVMISGSEEQVHIKVA